MSLFLSTFTHKIDKKGRVSVPATFRAILNKSATKGFVAFRSPTLAAIDGFAMENMEALASRIDGFQLFAEDQTDLTASIFADADVLMFDGDGRVMLTEALRKHASVEESIAFVGRGPTFQLWNPGRFENYQQQARARLKVSRPRLASKPSEVAS